MTNKLFILCIALVFPCVAQDGLYKKTLKKNYLKQFSDGENQQAQASVSNTIIKNFKSLSAVLYGKKFYVQLDTGECKEEKLNDVVDVLLKLPNESLYVGTFQGKGHLAFLDPQAHFGDKSDNPSFPFRVIYKDVNEVNPRLIAKILDTEAGFVFDAIDQRNWSFSAVKNRKYRAIYKNEKNFIKK